MRSPPEPAAEVAAALRRPLRDVRIGAVVVAVALGGFGAWAGLVPLTEGVVAVGTVAVEREHQTIQHLEGGIVETVHVHEGSEVQAGEVLVDLAGHPSAGGSGNGWTRARWACGRNSTACRRNEGNRTRSRLPRN